MNVDTKLIVVTKQLFVFHSSHVKVQYLSISHFTFHILDHFLMAEQNSFVPVYEKGILISILGMLYCRLY